ncbi:MAG: right-handed parallel beta-helix repeat-containing protein [Candidatus Edwardsbacteria bacterium]|nr:right-handed parallel beta-helix repeat-containing protein [Candidatus Edwardsbacteria bacterium]
MPMFKRTFIAIGLLVLGPAAMFAAVGGPDGYGYRFVDNDAPDTAAYRWVDTILGSWTTVTGLVDDNVVGPFDIGFQFPYYWYRVSQFWIHSNGGISFSLPARVWTPQNPGENGFPNIKLPQDLIGAYGLDFDFTAAGRCKYRARTTAPESLIVSWLGVPRWNTTDLYTFQLILARADSTIRVQIQDVTNPPNNSGSLGIENAGGNVGLSYLNNGQPVANRIHDSLAIKYYPPATSTYTATDAGVVAALNNQSGAVVQHTGDPLTVRATLKNFGTTNLTNLKAVCRIRNSANTIVYTDSLLGLSITMGQQLPVAFGQTFTPAVIGTYTLVVRAYIAENPVNASNDSIVVELPVVAYQQWAAYDDGVRDGWKTWSGTSGANPTGFANYFEVSRIPVAIDSVQALINRTVIGQQLYVELRDTTGAMGGPGAVIAADTITFGVTGQAWVKVDYVTRNIKVDNGKFFVCLKTPSAGLQFAMDRTAPIARRTWECVGGWNPYRAMETDDAMIRVNCRSVILPAFYVDSLMGNDAYPGISAAPFRTIGWALNRISVTTTDTIYVRNGTYAEQVDILPAHSGTAALRHVIAAQAGHAPRIKPAGRPYALADSAGNYVTIKGLTIYPGTQQMAAVIFNGNNVTFSNNTVYAPTMGPALLVMSQNSSVIRGNTIGPISDNAYPGQGIWTYMTDGLRIDSNAVTGMIDAGILVRGSANTAVTRNLVDQCHLGVSFEGSTGDSLCNNTIDNNTNSGVYCTGLSGTLVARNNNITNNVYGLCWSDSQGTVSSDYNNVWNNTYNYKNPKGPGDTNVVSPGANDISADPLYAAGYHLQAGSPCINAGMDVGLPYLGAAPDIGAYEDWAKLLLEIGAGPDAAVGRFGLSRNRPNPFHQSTTINYQLPAAGKASLKVYNIAGQMVKTLVNQPQPPGVHQVKWDGKDDRGRAVSAGVYYYRLVIGDRQQTRALLYIK